MAKAKTQLFTEKQNKLATQMKALSHPARIAIIQYLLYNGSVIGKQLVNAFGLSQATISQHLKELKSAGIITGKKQEKTIRYMLDEKAWKKYKSSVESAFKIEK